MADLRFVGEGIKSEKYTSIGMGGVVAFSVPEASSVHIRDCANYGTITFSGLTNVTALGGIMGAFFFENRMTGIEPI